MIGEVYIGLAQDLSRIYLKLKDLLKSVLVGGIIGSGKTVLLYLLAIQLIRHGVKVWWVDCAKRDGLYIASLLPGVPYFRLNDNFYWNPIQKTPGLSDREIYSSFVENFSRCNHLLEGAQAHTDMGLLETVFRLERSANPHRVTIPDLYQTIRTEIVRRRVSDYRDVVQNRLELLLNSVGRTVNCHHGFSIDKLADTSFVLDATGCPEPVQSFMIGHLITILIKSRMARRMVTNELDVFIIFDEANRLFPKNQELNPAEPIPTLSVVSQTAREFGVGLCGSTQTPSFMADSGLKSQSFIKILIGSLGSNQDYLDMGNVMGMSEDQIDWLKTHAKVGQAVVKLAGGTFTSPFIVTVPFLDIKGIVG
jgi:hypothetical protein